MYQEGVARKPDHQVVYTPKPYDNKCDCKPRYCYSPYGIFRWIQVAVGLIVCGCISTTCNATACVNISNQFTNRWIKSAKTADNVALNLAGQAYVVSAAGVAIILTLLFMMFYSCNLHRAATAPVMALERLGTLFVIIIYFAAACCETYYAAISWQPQYRELSRVIQVGIQPQWIAAAVFAWINFFLYILDFVGQRSANYPAQLTNV